jgi:hypothetical protein
LHFLFIRAASSRCISHFTQEKRVVRKFKFFKEINGIYLLINQEHELFGLDLSHEENQSLNLTNDKNKSH